LPFRRGDRGVGRFRVIERAVITIRSAAQFMGELDLSDPSRPRPLRPEVPDQAGRRRDDHARLPPPPLRHDRRRLPAVTVVGTPNDRGVTRIQRFLVRNASSVTVCDRETAAGADRARTQGQDVGAPLAIARSANAIRRDGDAARIARERVATVQTRAGTLASDATARKLDHPDGYGSNEGQGFRDAATALDAQFCAWMEAVIGEANSVGRAAVFLAPHVAHVPVLVGGADLTRGMPGDPVSLIDRSARTTLCTRGEITALRGARLL
jgi:thioredoxin reductase